MCIEEYIICYDREIMRVYKIIVGALITLLYSFETIGSLISLPNVGSDQMSYTLGAITGSGIMLSVGLLLLITGIKNTKF